MIKRILIISLIFLSNSVFAENPHIMKAITQGVTPQNDHDNILKNKDVIYSATKKLIMDNKCSLDDIREQGWLLSPSKTKNNGVDIYFTYCGGMHAKNRIYLNSSSGKTF